MNLSQSVTEDPMSASLSMSSDDNMTSFIFDFDFDHTIPASYTIIICLLMMVVAVGVIGNLLVIIIVIRDPTMRTTPNVMVASLALADCLVLMMSVPYKIMFRFTKTWMFGHFWCKAVNHLAVSCGLVSIYALVALSADRYYAIVRPTSYTGARSTCKLSFLIGSIWVVSIALGVPSFAWSYVMDTLHPQIKFCYMDAAVFTTAYTILYCVLIFIFPLMLIGVYYSLVAWRLLESAWAIPGEANDKRPQLRSRKRLALVVLAIVVLFAVCRFPSICVELLQEFHPTAFDSPHMVHAKLAANLLTYLNPCINPYILCIMSSTYRNQFRRYLCWLCERKRRFQRSRSITLTSKGSSTRTKLTEFLPM